MQRGLRIAQRGEDVLMLLISLFNNAKTHQEILGGGYFRLDQQDSTFRDRIIPQLISHTYKHILHTSLTVLEPGIAFGFLPKTGRINPGKGYTVAFWLHKLHVAFLPSTRLLSYPTPTRAPLQVCFHISDLQVTNQQTRLSFPDPYSVYLDPLTAYKWHIRITQE